MPGYCCAAPNRLTLGEAPHPQGSALAILCLRNSVIGIAEVDAGDNCFGKRRHHCSVYRLRREALAHPTLLPGLLTLGKFLALVRLGQEVASC